MMKFSADWFKDVEKLLNQNVKKTEVENEFRPNLAIDDAKRKQFFTHYDIDKMNRIREIKLNQL
jgi:hypothetical protein